MNSKSETCFVGVDVSKEKLDVYRPDTQAYIQFDNSQEGASELCKNLSRKKKRTVVVMEATGGYEKTLLHQLQQVQREAAVVNPRRVRDFAKGIGIDAKTDPIDAKVISRYGEVVEPTLVACKSDHQKKHGAMVDRRDQLLNLINQESNRLKQTWDEAAVSLRPNSTSDWRLKRYQLIPPPGPTSDGGFSLPKTHRRGPHGESTGDGQVPCDQ